MKKLIPIILILMIAVSAHGQAFMSGTYGYEDTYSLELGAEFGSETTQFKPFVGWEYGDEIGNTINLGVRLEQQVLGNQRSAFVAVADAKYMFGNINTFNGSENDSFAASPGGDLYAGGRFNVAGVNLYLLTGVRSTTYDGGHAYWVPASVRVGFR